MHSQSNKIEIHNMETMQILEIVAVVALVIIGIFIYRNKTQQ